MRLYASWPTWSSQDWLLPGRRVEHVVCGLDGQPCRLIAPDPRYFALHKLWLAKKPTRNPLKRPKDEKQGSLLLSAVAERMPHYSLDDAFRDTLPTELIPHFDSWCTSRYDMATKAMR
ncbi:MAG TPA: GSU2403 family nucleotidyltransferase fold protein [Steroidobacteraceae bacterium]|nr:GSU2403 family nucleotidyltransferase fold protein [Steroidobacteraceae bacterium]